MAAEYLTSNPLETSTTALDTEAIVRKHASNIKVTLANGEFIIVTIMARPINTLFAYYPTQIQLDVVANDGATGLPLGVTTVSSQ